ncbi:MAG TPA: hypothetical protein VI895_11440 [Bdellovibrionota bacterium]|nr:hypothetical protein [Bdellovibrionota bacterium]
MRWGFDIHGVSLVVESDMEKAAELLCDRLEPYAASHAMDPVLNLRIERATGPTIRKTEKIPKQLNWIRSRPLWGSVNNDVLTFTDGTSVAEVTYPTGSACLAVDESTLADAHFFGRTFALLSVVELLRTRGFFYVHGALVTNNSRSILVLGRGGAGKSTLAISLIRHGYRIVADDNLLIDSAANTIRPLEQELSLPRETAEKIEIVPLGVNDRGKIRIPLKALPGHWRAPYALPTDIVLLSDTGTEEALIPVPRSAIFKVILEENPMILGHPPAAGLHLDSIRAILKGNTYQYRFRRRSPIQFANFSSHFIVAFRSGSVDSHRLY